MRGLAWAGLLLFVGCSTTGAHTDAGAPPRFDTSSLAGVVDPETLRWLIELRKAQLGESADLDGDGIRELTVVHTLDGGTRRSLQVGALTAFVEESFPDGRQVYTLNYENYGSWVWRTELGPAPGQALFLFDDDGNAVLDRRITRWREPDGGLTWVEDVPDAGGTWSELQRWSSTPAQDQSGGGKCQGTSNMPMQIGALSDNVPGVKFVDQGEAAGCNLQRASKLGAALRCSKDQLKSCLQYTNPTAYNDVIAHLASDEWHIGCNNPCPGAHASTEPRYGNIAATTNFNQNTIDTATPDELCGLLMHEMMHMAEIPSVQSEHDANGSDLIYSCARYCSHCSMPSHQGPPRTPNQDCVVCSGPDPIKRAACGIKKKLESTGQGYSVCTGGLTPMQPCSDWWAPVTRDCNDQKLYDSTDQALGCCNMCPPATPTNSAPCSLPGPMTDTCMMKPPQCQ